MSRVVNAAASAIMLGVGGIVILKGVGTTPLDLSSPLYPEIQNFE